MKQQRSSTDEKWISYVLLVFAYSLAVVSDWMAALLFTLVLLEFAGLVFRKWMFALVELILLADLALKSPYLPLSIDKFMLDTHCVQMLFQREVSPEVLAYIALHLYNLYLLIVCLANRGRGPSIKTWGPLMTQTMVYLQPLLMFGLSLISQYEPLRVVWAILSCLQVLDTFPRITHLTCCLIMTCYFFLPGVGPQYGITLSGQPLPQLETQNIVLTTFAVILVFLNVYSNPHPNYKQSRSPPAARESRLTVGKRHLQNEEAKTRLKSKVTIVFAVVVCLATTSLGNIFILLGVYVNVPVFKAKRFFPFLAVGTVVSILLEPQQTPYFIYLYTIVLVVGQEIGDPASIEYSPHSYSFVMDFYRLYIMLNHVSFLNWLIGIFRSSFIVFLALSTRIACRYFHYSSVFLGTNDSYGIEHESYDLTSLTDSVLILYLLLLCLYSPTATKTYANSHVTNVLLQYPLLEKCKSILVLLRSFNWLAYIAFSLIILSRRPSIYIVVHIFLLVLIVTFDTIRTSQSFPNKSRILRALWGANFYATIVMIFTRYFYFLKQYESHSDAMDYLLGLLTQYNFWLGLQETTGSIEGVALAKYFLYDTAVLVISWVSVYVYKVKILYQQKTQSQGYEHVLEDHKLSTRLIEAEQKQYQDQGVVLTEEEKKQIKFEKVEYFYLLFVKPVNMKAFFAEHESKFIEKVLRDCLLDLCFPIVVLAFYMERESIQFLFYLPHFVVYAYAYYHRFTGSLNLDFTRKILGITTAWSFMILLCSYLYITYQQIYSEDIPSAIARVYVTYIMCIVICFLYRLSCCLPERPGEERKYHCLIYLCFPFTVESQKLWTEILSIFGEFWLGFTMALFLTNIFTPRLVSTLVHPFLALYLLLQKVGKAKSQNWLYYVCLVSIIDIWNYDFFAYLTVLAITVFYAVKSAQKLSEEEIDGSLRDQFSETSSAQSPEITQTLTESVQKQWGYYTAYCSLVWLLPQIISLIWMFGVVWLSPSLIATVLIGFSYGNLLYQVLAERAVGISKPTFIITALITALFFVYELLQYFYRYWGYEDQPYNHSEMGLFLIFASCFFYLILKKRENWYRKRSMDAQAYWDQKTELVGQLGSQLHNEKKLISLEKYYTSKEKLTEKVNKISMHLKQNGKRAYFQSLDNILKPRNDGEEAYELYTNMLIFLDMRLLRRCFLMFNQYIDTSKDGNVCEKARTMRSQILRIYLRSFSEAFNRIKTESENDPAQLQMSASGRSSVINLEKINEINLRYKKCYELISRSTQRFNRLFRLLVYHFEIVSMMTVIGWNLFGGVYTIPANILIFGWAVVLQNKTTTKFWLLVMTYASFILVMKQVLALLPSAYLIDFIFYYHGQDYLYEFLIIVVSVLQLTLIRFGGTRSKTYSERESIYDAFYRVALNKAANSTQLDKEQEFMEVYRSLSQPDSHSFLYRVFSKSRFKPGKDFYPLMASIQLAILLYIFFFYDMMELESRKNRKSIGELLTSTQFSSHMVIALFVQIVIMVIDRLIVSLNLVDEDNQALENFFLNFTFSVADIKYQVPRKLDRFGIFDLLLVLKYLFHVLLLLFINFFVYFFIPSAGLTKSLIPSSDAEMSKSYTYLTLFLFLYFAYLLVSGLQIKHGFNRNKCKNVLMEKYHWLNYYMYKVFTAIPFAWEFKKICDWTVTSTALPLFHWMKFEDINARLYESKCEAEMIKVKPLGAPWNKYLLGPAGFMLILLIVFSPFVIYSPVNPFAVKDAVVGAQLNIYLRMDLKDDYKFFSTSHAQIVEKDQSIFDIDHKNQNIFMLRMSKFPDENFLVSEPMAYKLADKIKDSAASARHQFSFVLELVILEQEGGQSRIEWASKKLSPSEMLQVHDLLHLSRRSVVVEKFYSPLPGEVGLQSIVIQSPSDGEYFEVGLHGDAEHEQLYFYYLTSNKFKVSIGILTFYLTYILVISRFLRFYLTGTVRNILYEGCYLESILVLCEAVREARIVENFLQEESFYFQLMDIMRQPKAFKQITGNLQTFRKNCLIALNKKS